MPFKPILILLSAWILLMASAHAETMSPPSNTQPVMGEGVPAPTDDRPQSEDGPASNPAMPSGEPVLTGLLVDRTVTMIGKTFFQQFSQLRLDSVILSNTGLVINERPSARWGSIVWVAEGNRILFEATLPPRLSDVDEYAKAAVDQVEQMVLKRKVMQALQQDQDLADDEF